jgi:hypothetical protein
MRAGVTYHASSVRSAKPLVVRAGLVRTFGSLAGFVVVTFLCGGLYILEDAFANPIEAGAAAIIGAAFIITLAAMLLFFLIKPSARSRTKRHSGDFDYPAPAVRPFLRPAAGAVRQGNLRNNLPYQRFYIDHSLIRP